jgi:hypothetical protein
MKSLVLSITDFIREDWKENPVRTVLEIMAWTTSIACSILMAATVPEPPFLILYPLFVFHCIIFAYCAYTRGSTGMLANYIMLSAIDTIALIRLITL